MRRGEALNPQERRMARRTEDHSLGDVDGDATVWDRGTYANKTGHEMATCLRRGHLSVVLNGEKVHGRYTLTRVREGEDETWLLVKRRDDVADAINRAKRSR